VPCWGTVAGDLTLMFRARGGVFIAGGIAPRIVDLLVRSEFLARFRAKGRFEPYWTGSRRSHRQPGRGVSGAQIACCLAIDLRSSMQNRGGVIQGPHPAASCRVLGRR